MSDSFAPAPAASQKARRYLELQQEVLAVLAGEDDQTARLASVAALLKSAFPHFLWVGFYLVDARRPEELVVGPYQGSLGCLRIPFGRGVCGAAAAERRTVRVEDVEAFPGHIACDARSRSEIVVPILSAGRLLGVLDVDAENLAAFDAEDAAALERLMACVFGG